TTGKQSAVEIEGTGDAYFTETADIPVRTTVSAVPVQTSFSPFDSEEPNDPSVTVTRPRMRASPPPVIRSGGNGGDDATVIVPSRNSEPSTTAPAIRAPNVRSAP